METSILRLTVAGLALAAGLASLPAAARQSAAPDLGGYTYIDSRESGGPVFDYVDISSSATATRLDLDDDEVAEGIPLGFTFNFYGIDYEEVAISSNGNLAFGAATDYRNGDVLPIPQPAGTDGWQNPPFVAPWFGDLCPRCGDEGAIYYATLGEAPNRRFVVQYRVPPYPGYGNETLDFQVILYEGSNEILFQYQDTTVGDPWEDHRFYATVGIQGTDDAGLNYSAGEAVIEDGLAIRFLPPAGPFIGLNAPASRWAAPGKTVTYRFTLANGTGADAEFTVSLSGHGWPASASPDHMMVAAGDTASFDVTVTVPAKAELTALADRLTVTVSGNDTSASRSVTTRTAPIEQLTYGDDDSDEPSLSADGSKVAFGSWADLLGSNADGSMELFVINTDGTGLKQLTSISDGRAWIEQPSLSADGGKVAFVSDADPLGFNADGSYELFVINTDGTGLRQLTSLSAWWFDIKRPSLSADGSRVAFVSDADLRGSNADGTMELFVMNTDGTGLRQLTSLSRWNLWVEEPSLSADGNRVVFVSNANLLGSNADGSRELFVMNTDGTGLRQLTSLSRWDLWVEEPSLSADGGRVAFVSDADLLGDGSNADGSRELFVMNTDGTGLRQLTSISDGEGWVEQPSLSADGSRVAFVSDADLLGDGSNADGSYELFVINTDGTGLMQVTSLSHLWFDIKRPSLSANGSKVAFAANVDLFGDDPYTKEASQIYVADLALMRALTAGIVVEPSAGLVTSEAGMSATFTVRLTIPPTHEVVLSLSSDDPTEGSVSPVNLHFTPENWNMPQTVTVTGLDDDEVDGDMPYTVSISAASDDEAYHGKTASVEVVNQDDEQGEQQDDEQGEQQDDEQGEQQDDEQGEQPGRGGTKLISGGGGAFGWLSLLGGALLALRRRRVVLALLAGMTLAVPASAEWYAGAMAGRAVGDTDSGDVTAALEAAGIDATAKVKDRTRTAWRLFGGYRWNEYLAVEGGYTDLGKITTRFAGSGSVTLEQLGDDRPASGKGVELAVVGSYPLSESVSGYARFGLWRWKAEYDLRGAVDESDTERGTDPVLGLGIEARLAAAWALRLGWDRYRVDSEDHDFFGLGLLYRFGGE